MAIEKPAPLMIGNKAFYSLTSYDPVEIEVEVPLTTEFDIELALDASLEYAGFDREKLKDTAWVAERFNGATNLGEVRANIREELEQMNASMAEQQKMGKALDALKARLGQSVPEQHVAAMRQMVEMRFMQQLADEGTDLKSFMDANGMSQISLNAMFDQQAQDVAESEAALDAFARERKLKVSEGELGHLLSLPPNEAHEVIESARSAGHYSQLEESALRSKAASIVLAECSCTYRHETAAEAEARIEEIRAALERHNAEKAAEKGDSGLHLV